MSSVERGGLLKTWMLISWEGLTYLITLLTCQRGQEKQLTSHLVRACRIINIDGPLKNNRGCMHTPLVTALM